MMFIVLKPGELWKLLNAMITMKVTSFEGLISGYVYMFSENVNKEILQRKTKFWKIKAMRTQQVSLTNSNCSEFDRNIALQQYSRFETLTYEGQLYFCGEHKLYGLTVKVSTLKIGQATFLTISYADVHRISV